MNPNDLFQVLNQSPILSSRLESLEEISKATWLKYNVKHYGVVGDGVTDDREAIDALIEQVSAEGGGPLFFPPGDYAVSVIDDPVLNKRRALKMLPRVSLMGQHRAFCRIRVLDGQAPYKDLITHNFKDKLRDIEISGLTFDQNRSGNPVTTAQLVAEPCRTIGFWGGNDILVSACRFTNFESYNNIMLSGNMHNLSVVGNLFDGVNGGTAEDHDYSAVYLKVFRDQWNPRGSGIWVLGNVFRADGAGKFGVTTAIETHGSGAFVHGNYVEDFRIGIIASGERVDETIGVSVVGNNVRNCQRGIDLWSKFHPDLGFTSGPGVQSCRISGNHITIDLDAWDWKTAPARTGVMITPWNDAAIWDLLITENIVRYLPYTVSPNIDSSNCITALNSQPDPDKNWMIINNILQGSPGNPVRIDPQVENLVLDNNI